jgi:hypothetical protein
VAVITGGLVSLVGPGTANITASQAGNNGYSAATSVTRQLTVNPAGAGATDNSDVPAMPEWALLGLAGVLAAAATRLLRKKRAGSMGD